jgi:hypothetical protein
MFRMSNMEKSHVNMQHLFLMASVGSMEIGGRCLSIIFCGFVKFVKFVVN